MIEKIAKIETLKQQIKLLESEKSCLLTPTCRDFSVIPRLHDRYIELRGRKVFLTDARGGNKKQFIIAIAFMFEPESMLTGRISEKLSEELRLALKLRSRSSIWYLFRTAKVWCNYYGQFLHESEELYTELAKLIEK